MLQTYQKQATKALANLDHAARQIDDETERLELARQRVKDTEEAQQILQQLAETIQQHAHAQVASVVSRCLSAVFGGDAYSLEIDFQQKRGKTEAVLLFGRDGYKVDPLEASGGGVLDVAAFALRLVSILLSRPTKRRLLVLDESFKHLSSEYRPAVRALLQKLSKEMRFQIIMVSHSIELQCGKVIELE